MYNPRDEKPIGIYVSVSNTDDMTVCKKYRLLTVMKSSKFKLKTRSVLRIKKTLNKLYYSLNSINNIRKIIYKTKAHNLTSRDLDKTGTK